MREARQYKRSEGTKDKGGYELREAKRKRFQHGEGKEKPASEILIMEQKTSSCLEPNRGVMLVFTNAPDYRNISEIMTCGGCCSSCVEQKKCSALLPRTSVSLGSN